MAKTVVKFELEVNQEFSGGEAGLIQVDLAQLNEAVSAYVFQYGLKQMLNDVHAGETAKKTPDEATRKANKAALVAKKLASLYAGEVAQARVGQSGDPVMRKMRELAEVDLKAKLKAIGKKVADYDKSVWAKVLDKQVAAKEQAYRKAAEKILSVKVEKAEDDFDIMSVLGEAEAEAPKAE
jgi:hypothetical protein